MANRRVTIWRYAKIDGKWRYISPTYGRNHKIKPEEGTYYIRWRNGSKTEWQHMLTAQAYGIVLSERNTGPEIPGVTSPALQMADTISVGGSKTTGSVIVQNLMRS